MAETERDDFALQDYTLGQLEQNAKLRARQLCKTLSQLGPSFVKIGQALSSRPDLLPQIYLEVTHLSSHSPNFAEAFPMTLRMHAHDAGSLLSFSLLHAMSEAGCTSTSVGLLLWKEHKI